MTTSNPTHHGAPRHADAVQEPHPTDRPALGRRLCQAGVGLAAFALLGGASYATQAEVATSAVPGPSTSATVDYATRDERAARTDRDTPRPTPTPTRTPSSSPTAILPKAKVVTPKPKPKPTPAKKATPAAPAKAEVIGTRYTRVNLNVRTAPSDNGTLLTVLDAGDKVSITGNVSGQWQGVSFQGRLAWVKGRYLVRTKPQPVTESSRGTSGGTSASGNSGGSSFSGAPCPSGSSVENGLTPDAKAVHRAVCHRFPQITSYGGVRADSMPEHPSGRALDCMIPNYSSSSGNALGWEVANWLRANSGRLGITEIIFDQRIWTTQRAGEGWRWMSDRGGDTANHRDHVHVSVSGYATS